MEKLKSLNKSTKKTKENNKKDAMNDAAAAAYDAVSDGVSDVKDAVGKFVQFDANKTNFFIKLRKNLDVKFPGISKEQSIIIIIAFLLFAPRAKSLSSSSSSLFFFFKSRRAAFSLSSVPNNNSCRADSKLALPSRDGFVPRLPRRQPVHGFNGRIHAEFTMVL